MSVATSSIILDFDGLIVDTETPIFEAWRAVYERHGRRLGLGEWQHALGTHGGFDPLAHLDGLVDGTLERAAVVREVKAASARGCDGQPLLPGVEPLLRDARALRLGRAVASSSSCAVFRRQGRQRRRLVSPKQPAACRSESPAAGRSRAR